MWSFSKNNNDNTIDDDNQSDISNDVFNTSNDATTITTTESTHNDENSFSETLNNSIINHNSDDDSLHALLTAALAAQLKRLDSSSRSSNENRHSFVYKSQLNLANCFSKIPVKKPNNVINLNRPQSPVSPSSTASLLSSDYL